MYFITYKSISIKKCSNHLGNVSPHLDNNDKVGKLSSNSIGKSEKDNVKRAGSASSAEGMGTVFSVIFNYGLSVFIEKMIDLEYDRDDRMKN